ncbi:hypothetical protein JCM10908_005019 [Rhodotorula pacifica]|uniref:uncharacterized protein n=1 Tax=Rhodotorula pacifica TaxID=1495444 RepID=UPI00317CABB9
MATPAQEPQEDQSTRASQQPTNRHRHRHRFVSDDLNVRISGRILEQKEPGRIDGIRLELLAASDGDESAGEEQEDDAITVLYPQLVSIHTKPESQTLVSINTGERLLTLETPLIADDNGHDDNDEGGSEDDNAIEEEEEEADDDVSDLEGDEAPSASTSTRQKRAKPSAPPPKKKKRRPVVVTLHEGFLPASEATQLEESSLYSTTFRIIIDGPSYPLPHFDPAVLAPPTPAVRPHGSSVGGNDSTSVYGGVLNSPTLQRALLSPLLSPQRRAASQGSDMSVPPLSLGLSRASRPSFNSSERPYIDTTSSGAGQKGKSAPVTLVTLIPSLAPPRSTAYSSASSTTPQVGPSSIHQHHGHSNHNQYHATPAPAPTLAGTLTTSLSSAAKRAAEEILALRRTHDAYQRRAKAELDVLEARIENFRSEAGVAVAVGGTEAVVRGFKTKEDRAKEREERNASVSRSRERRGRSPPRSTAEGPRGRSRGPNGSGSVERPPSSASSPASSTPAPAPVAAATTTSAPGSLRPALGSSSTSSSSVQQNRDEAASALIRAQDEREEDERGRSRSRTGRSGGGPVGAYGPGSSSRGRAETAGGATGSSSSSASAQRSRSRSKAVAEATLRAVEAAKERQAAAGTGSGSPSPARGSAALAPPSTTDQGGERRAKSPLSQESGSATSPEKTASPKSKQQVTSTKDSSATRSTAKAPPPPSSAPSPSSTSQPLPPASRLHPPGPGGSTTPAFAPSSHALVAIPETDELSIPLERTHSGGLNLAVPNEAPPALEVKQEPEEESDPPFEMDEDVHAHERDSASPPHVRQQAPALESPSLERDTAAADAPLLTSTSPATEAASRQQQIPDSSSFRPGSYQRASALSASYSALLSSAKSAPSQPAVQAVASSPSISRTNSRTDGRPPFSDSSKTLLSEDQLPPFSPPDAKSYTSTSAREDAKTALISATFEHAERFRRGDADGSSRGSSSAGTGGGGGIKSSSYAGPDPRDVRKGEQKIRDVLAMDVPSHRPRSGASSRQHEQHSTPGRGGGGGFDDDEDEDDAPSSEEDDTVEELASPAAVGMGMSSASIAASGDASAANSGSMPVGSLPIALGRPSTVNAALSSWRPDPERLWAQQRRERKTSVPASKEGMWVPPLRSPGLAAAAEPAPAAAQAGVSSPQITSGGQAVLLPVGDSTPSTTAPVEIGSPTIPRPADVGGGNGGSSLARSLRAQQGVGSFVQLTSSGTTAHRRSGGEGTGSAPGPNGRDPFENERRSADRGSDGDDEDQEDEEDAKISTARRGDDRAKEEGEAAGRAKPTNEDDEDEEDDDGEFVPPHLVKGRADREDEEWLSRSVPKS